jgi:Fic family protein
MKLPQSPPAFADVAKNIGAKRFSEILEQIPQWAKHDRYLNWDDLCRRPPPAGFTHQEWWLGIKLIRRSQLRQISLRDKRGEPFQFGQPDSLSELLHKIDCGLGAVLGLPEAIDHPGARDRYVINTLIQESITSSQLEGAATTRAVAREMLRSGRPPRDRSEQMIVNNFLTMQHIRDLRDADLSQGLVFELHRRITSDTLESPDAAGRFRKPDEDVRVEDDIEGMVFHRPPPAAELPARLKAMCDFANGESPDFFVHPVVRAIILHFWLAYDHPFVDGNGRTARALFYWSMLRRKYDLFEFISISDLLLRAPVRYAMAFLHTETDENDLTYFILHQAQVIRDAVEALQNYLAGKKKELRATAETLHGIEGLNHRQKALLAHALREPPTLYLISAHQRSHGVTHQTARDDLFGLVDRGLLLASKDGRRYQFRITPNLGEKIDKLGHGSPSQDSRDSR